jgi:hypothetical protein
MSRSQVGCAVAGVASAVVIGTTLTALFGWAGLVPCAPAGVLNGAFWYFVADWLEGA